MADSVIKQTNQTNKVKQDKLHWVVKHKTSFKDEEDFLETILMDCGVKLEDIPKFLNPNRSMIYDPFLMKNMDKVVEILHENITENKNIAILPDNDNDGLCSASILGQFIEQDTQHNSDIIYVFSDGKSHGLTYDLVKNFKQGDIDLFIVPDASTTMAELNLIQRNFPDMEIIVIDHHLVSDEYYDTETGKWILEKEAKEIIESEPERIKVDRYTNHILSVNDTDGQYPNPTLSGGGVALKVIEAFKQKYPDDCTDDCIYKYLDLVSLAICGDGMDLRNLETRYYVVEGMKKAYRRNPFFNELQDRLSDEMAFDRYIGSAEWVLIPKVNGVIRFGKKAKKGEELGEKEQLFYAILGREGTVQYKPRRKSKNDPEPEIEEHTLAWDAARMAVNVKSRQDTEVRKYFKEIQEQIEKEHLDVNSVIFVDGTKAIERGETSGLIANKLTNEYHRPVVLMREFDSTTFGGSCRGYAKGNIKDIRELLESTGKVAVMGHRNAAGVRFNKEDLTSIIEEINEKYPLNSLQTIHECDWEIPASKLKKEYVAEVAQNYEIWGNTVPEPTFAITNLVISASDINGYGENNNFIRFTYNGIVFVKKYCSQSDFPTMICKSRTTIGKPKYKVRLNLICQFVLNAWEDKVNPEVKILYFDSVKDDGKSEIDDWLDNDSTQDSSNNIYNSFDRIGDNRDINGDTNNEGSNRRPDFLEEPVKKKRGRPPKKREPLILDDEIDSVEKTEAKVEEKIEDKPKKRGRPPKVKVDENVGEIKMKPVEDFDDDDIEDVSKKVEEKVDKEKKRIYTVDDIDFVF